MYNLLFFLISSAVIPAAKSLVVTRVPETFCLHRGQGKLFFGICRTTATAKTLRGALRMRRSRQGMKQASCYMSSLNRTGRGISWGLCRLYGIRLQCETVMSSSTARTFQSKSPSSCVRSAPRQTQKKAQRSQRWWPGAHRSWALCFCHCPACPGPTAL